MHHEAVKSLLYIYSVNYCDLDMAAIRKYCLFYVFVLVYGNLCGFTVSEHIVFPDNEMII